jgi:GTP-binding protein HflX
VIHIEHIVVVCTYPENNPKNAYDTYEILELAKADDLVVEHTLTQIVKSPNPATFIGQGKVIEVKQAVANLEADFIVFNIELSGIQLRNLEDIIGVQVVDRTMLILDIFAKRAKSKEAMLQVELAQLDYLTPRLSGIGSNLNKQQGGIGSRGPGEKKLELDRTRVIQERTKLKKELASYTKSRARNRQRRQDSILTKVAIVGYTNAGKSSLLNRLLETVSHKKVLEKDMLFATLSPSTRRIETDVTDIIISDTVGFVSNLPHHLVEAFKSTLEHVQDADIIIHVVDSSHPEKDMMIDLTNEVLKNLGASEKKTLYVYNKTDLLTEIPEATHHPHIFTSMIDGGHLKVLRWIESELKKEFPLYTFSIPFDNQKLVSYLYEHGKVLSQEDNQEGTLIRGYIHPSIIEPLYQYKK